MVTRRKVVPVVLAGRRVRWRMGLKVGIAPMVSIKNLRIRGQEKLLGKKLGKTDAEVLPPDVAKAVMVVACLAVGVGDAVVAAGGDPVVAVRPGDGVVGVTAGEVLVPIDEGAITQDQVVGELTEMCSGAVKLRESDEEITLFKSIGMAMSDLVGAGCAYRATT